MKKKPDVLATSPIFKGIDAAERESLLVELGSFEGAFARDEVIRHTGDALSEFPVLLEGLVQGVLVEGDRRQLIQQFEPGESFAEAVPFSVGRCPVDIVAVRKSRILFLPADAVRNNQSEAGKRLYANLIESMSHKVTILSQKLALISTPRLSDRILSFVATLPVADDGSVMLPFKYRELAEFLGVNKTSLSRTIGQMEDEGVLRTEGRRIWVLKRAEDESSAGSDDGRDDADEGWREELGADDACVAAPGVSDVLNVLEGGAR